VIKDLHVSKKLIHTVSLSLLALVCIFPGRGWSQSPAPGTPPGTASRPLTAIETGCGEASFRDSYFITDGHKTFDDERNHALALRLKTAVYQDSAGEARAPKTLGFGELVRIIDPGEGTQRLRIKDNSGQPVGWVDRASVLCATYPLRDVGGTGLYKRAIVRTDTALQGQVVGKKLYQTPLGAPGETSRCDGPCAEASRFQWFFVYAEENEHYLISESANLGSTSGRVLGWLPKKDGYSWNTALGIRPIEELASPNGDPPRADPAHPDQTPHERYVCAYETEQKLLAGKPEDCSQILGGRRWYGLDVRMAVLQQTPRFYEVLFSNAQSAGRDLGQVAQGLNNLDVFFVLDGTKSMQGAINAIKVLMTQINERMKSKTGNGGVVRYGFRVYRDSNAKTRVDGVSNSEALPLNKAACDKSNKPEFDTAFAPVKAYDPEEDDDFSENTFGGLVQASEDISGCPNNAKLVFVIGDAGYDADKQRSRNFPAFAEQQIAQRFSIKTQGSKFVTQPVLVFIETPKEKAQLSNQSAYDKAYGAFETQGKTILSQLYAGTKLANDNNFILLSQDLMAGAAGQSAAIEQTIARIDSLLRPDAVREIMAGVQRGQSLEQVIEQLRNNSTLNIPIKYLDFVEESLCRQLGDQCHSQVKEAVNHAYVPADDKIVPEVLLSKDQLNSWIKILNEYKSFSSSVAGQRGRESLVNALWSAIGTIVVVDMQNDGVSLADRLQFAAGLPAAGHSHLMQYSDSDLRNTNLVPACEIENLKQYAAKKYEVLNIPYGTDGRSKPVFVQAPWPDDAACPMSAKGKAVPFIDGDVRPQNLNRAGQQTSYSLMHRRANESFFWLPVDDLP
jgi:hypothetical protein